MTSRCKLQIRREPRLDERWGALEARIDGQAVFDLAPGQLKAIFHDAGRVDIVIARGVEILLSRQVDLPGDHILLLSLNEMPRRWWQRFMRAGHGLSLTEVSRTCLAPSDPGPVRMLTSQFWIGTATEEQALLDLMKERPDYYSEENAEAVGTARHIALSGFADAAKELLRSRLSGVRLRAARR